LKCWAIIDATLRDDKIKMDKTALAVLVTVGFSIVGVVGDYFLKRASASEQSLKTSAF
jgi:hypothetical protein